MKQRIALVLGLLLLLGGSYFGLRLGQAEQVKGRGQAGVGSSAQPKVKVSFAKLPLAFEKNEGQVDSRVLFLARSRGGTVFVTEEGATFALAGDRPRAQDARERRHGAAPATEPEPRREGAAFKMKVVGASRAVSASGEEKLPGIANYFIGNEPAKWRTNIPTFAKVKVPSVYPGIDLVYYGNNEGRLEYDFAVAPGADPDVIRVAFEGVDRVEVNREGDLVLAVAGREVIQRRPLVYQEEEGRRRELGAAYVVLGGGEVAFRVEGRDRAHAMIIDPALIYSTYLGGSRYDSGVGIAVDGSGNAYVTGSTFSTNFPDTTTSPIQSSRGGEVDAFVVKINAAGTHVVYSTYLGGPGYNYGVGIAVDVSSNAYVTGSTSSPTNFPRSSPIQASSGGGTDAFVAKINAAGNGLTYSTYLGGSGDDRGLGIAVDVSSNAYVTGTTTSMNFPDTTTSPIQASSGGGTDAFVTKINTAGNGRTSTYLGGSDYDSGNGITVDKDGNAYVTGSTTSTNFPGTTTSPIQASSRGGTDAFVAKINTAWNGLTSTYLGGSGNDSGNGIAVDKDGNAYVTGSTTSTNFPGTTTSPIQASSGGGTDAFVAKINTAGNGLTYSTYLGGSGTDFGSGIAVDKDGNAYVTGSTTSTTNFPPSNPIQASSGGGTDAFVAKINAAGNGLTYSTYLGGSDEDSGEGIAVDKDGNAYVTGSTYSRTGFPTSSPIQASISGEAGDCDAFVAKISATMALTLSGVTPQVGPPSGGTTVTLTGGNFPGNAQVTFDGVAVATDDVVVVDPSRITAVTPPHAVGSVDVTVNGGGDTSTLSAAFTYINPPTISAVTPSSGSIIGGTQVTITGDDFQDGATVTFGGKAAEEVTFTSAITLLVTTPSHAVGAVDVIVTNPDGQSATLVGAFTYEGEPKHGCGCGGSGSGPALLVGLIGLWFMRARRRVTT